jgi:eukaryotic-like serine/threonine-protein kinase
VPDGANLHPSGSELQATHHRFGTRRLRELLATRGDTGLWLAEDDDGGEMLLRLYPALPTMEAWHALRLEASLRVYVVDPRLVPIEEIALDVWPYLSFACADTESLAGRIAREPMAPEAAVAVCADVAAALAALERGGMPPVDISPADVVLVGERARLLADVGLPGGTPAHASVDRVHLAPERTAAIADRRRGVRAALRGGASPTAESMTYALASIFAAAIHRAPDGAGPAPTALSARLEQVLRRGLAQRPSGRYGTPAALVEALGDVIGVHLPHSDVSAPRASRRRAGRATAARRRTRPTRRSIPIAIAAVVLLVAAAIGTVAGLAATAPDPPAALMLAGAGLSVEAPPGWLRAGAGEGPPAIGAPALVAHPPGQSSATALVITRAATPLLAKLAAAVPDAVRLGDYDAWRYRDVAVGAESVADVYVLEDGDRPIVAACLGPSDGPASVREGCSAALTTLRLHAGRVVVLGGDAATRHELARLVEDLNRVRTRERRSMAAAATGRRQAAAADRLAAAYARAAERARRLGTVGAPGDLPRLVERLEETGRAYAALATAVRATHRTAYARAGERVVAQERALQQDLAALAPTRPSP